MVGVDEIDVGAGGDGRIGGRMDGGRVTVRGKEGDTWIGCVGAREMGNGTMGDSIRTSEDT